MEYNTSQPKLTIPEYGRHIQKMIDYAVTVKDEKERDTVAQAIIQVMGQLNPHLRDVTDFKHKLWDHLFIISNFKLKVASPFPIPTENILTAKPEKVAYPSRNIKYRHYGKTVEALIEKAITMKDGDEKDYLVLSIANLMKRLYLTWNRDSVNDELIIDQLAQLSDNKLKLKEGAVLVDTADVVPKSNTPTSGKRKSYSGGSKGGRNNNHRNNNNRRRK